jgi:hypothetical protein
MGMFVGDRHWTPPDFPAKARIMRRPLRSDRRRGPGAGWPARGPFCFESQLAFARSGGVADHRWSRVMPVGSQSKVITKGLLTSGDYLK